MQIIFCILLFLVNGDVVFHLFFKSSKIFSFLIKIKFLVVNSYFRGDDLVVLIRDVRLKIQSMMLIIVNVC